MFKTAHQIPISLIISTSLLLGCAPRPDQNNSAEMARVFGECSFKLNVAALDLNTLPDDDPRVTIIQDIVDNLAESRYSQFPWKVKTTVLENPAPNAFTTGGGYMGAFSGVYAMAETEAALAGVIAHEMAHMEKLDNMELAGYLEEMLAQQFLQDGVEDYDTGVALNTVVDFCLAIPGLVSLNWKSDINTEINTNINPNYNDTTIPYIPFTFSDNAESNYSAEIRDPNNTNSQTTCNNKQREAYDQFVVINPEYYVEQFPNRDALPEIPTDISSGPGGLPGVASLWSVNPWVAFQHTAFSRYAECQSDEAGILNLFASGYNPLALNSSFQSIINLFDIDESDEDFRFLTHPALTQRIEDNRTFINLNSGVLPTTQQIESNSEDYQDYIVVADRITEFETLRDNARNAITGTAGIASAGGQLEIAENTEYEPITVVDIAVMLNEQLQESTTAIVGPQTSATGGKCDAFVAVYKKITGKDAKACI